MSQNKMTCGKCGGAFYASQGDGNYVCPHCSRPMYVSTPKATLMREAQPNPDREPTGHFTGRCGTCGSKDLWDDVTTYGCNNCGAVFMTGG